MVKVAQKRESSQIQIGDFQCVTVQAKLVEIHVNLHLTEGVCLSKLVQCMSIARTRMQQLKQSQQLQLQSSSQRVGALSLIPSCLGISGHPSGSRQGHPRYTGARSAGRLWVARTQFSTAVHRRNTANTVSCNFACFKTTFF